MNLGPGLALREGRGAHMHVYIRIFWGLCFFTLTLAGCGGGSGYDLSCLDAANPGTTSFVDHDQDGLSDDEELDLLKTNPCAVDTDEDGASDLIEVRGAGTDPIDPESTIPQGDFAIILPYEGDAVEQKLTFSTGIHAADILFLVDSTVSMQEEIANVRNSIQQIAAKASEAIPGSQIGVAHFEDFPYCSSAGGCGNGGNGFGKENDIPYRTLAPIGSSLEEVREALATAESRTQFSTSVSDVRGGDIPEALFDALFHSATDQGGSWSKGQYPGEVSIPDANCPSSGGKKRGKACFNEGSLPILVTITDAPAGDRQAIGGVSFEESSKAVRDIGGRFLGVSIGTEGFDDLERMAIATNTLRTDGGPLVYFANQGTVSDEIINGIEAIASEVRQDVTTETRKADPGVEADDGSEFVNSVRPSGLTNGESDGNAIKLLGQDNENFFGLLPGTEVDFDVRFQNEHQEPKDVTTLYQAKIAVVGNQSTTLDERNVYVVVPGLEQEVIILE